LNGKSLVTLDCITAYQFVGSYKSRYPEDNLVNNERVALSNNLVIGNNYIFFMLKNLLPLI